MRTIWAIYRADLRRARRSLIALVVIFGLLKPRNGSHHDEERTERQRLDLEDSSYSEDEAPAPA